MKSFAYTVEGAFAFPIDMLRYDGAWPEHETDSAIIEGTLAPHGSRPKSDRHDNVQVELRSLREPTPQRWESFMWRVAGDVNRVSI